ncbi:hypothetical protein E4Z66_06380 [Aliishimia ponticola]|uniref:Sulfate transporter family protein n=1 Tax=Aliishimia ponticola TaxID=2499833 RepID=A0A4S4NCU8_9RHOB|nr:EI24 domain-containing protein [Aliishimia ponticola]THH36575.1 hypothetical protein E4Z66_06380 [Aliishimia ponticola]
MILTAFFKALGQMTDPRFRRVLLLGIGLTIVLLIGATMGFVWLADWLVGDDAKLPWIGEVRWLDNLAGWGSALLMMVLSVFLMVPVASAITSMFLDRVADAVEDIHYPHLPPATEVTFLDGLRDTLSFLGLLIVANIAALIVYALLPFASVFIFWALNGFLLGREYFTLAAMRRVGRDNAKQLWRAHGTTIWIAGTLMAIPLSIPLVNLLVPIIGAATFTHLFHMLSGTARR